MMDLFLKMFFEWKMRGFQGSILVLYQLKKNARRRNPRTTIWGRKWKVQIYMLRLIMWYAMSLNCDKWHTANSILTYNFVFFYLYLYFIFCSGSVKRHPQNQMLGRRELVDGKVRYCMPKQLHLYCCLVG